MPADDKRSTEAFGKSLMIQSMDMKVFSEPNSIMFDVASSANKQANCKDANLNSLPIVIIEDVEK